MVQPENSTVLESPQCARHDGIFAFGCTIIEVDAGERGSPPALIYDDVHTYIYIYAFVAQLLSLFT